ncbi:S8 family peptidase (plasmid) [Planococcus maritimus]|nr:S8 family peptidase [Planococcus sp. SK3692]MDE4086840.1 S8 family peptidase [Planococcus maritimus]
MTKGIVKAIPCIESVFMLDKEQDPLKIINVQTSWNKGYKGEGIAIAVLDSGIDSKHPDLVSRIIGGANFTEEDEGDFSNFADYNGHGTHVAGIISSLNENRETSVAPSAKLLIVKVLKRDGSGDLTHLINGIYYAVNWRGTKDERVRVICLSLGIPMKNDELYKAIKYAVEQGVLIVVASGNQGTGDIEDVNLLYPGAYNEVVQVGAVDGNEQIAQFSNLNNQMDILAPGVNILSTHLDKNYKRLSGTSMAAPFVAGAAGLLIENIESRLERELSPNEIYAQLMKNTKNLGYPIKVEGNGLIYLI